MQKYIKISFILKRLPFILRILLLGQLVIFCIPGAFAQKAPLDTIKVTQDSIRGDITTTIKYSAKDSIVFHVNERVVNMYGDANIDYGDMSLKAATTAINYETNMLSAAGAVDSTGKAIGSPVFKQGSEMYTANRMNYNFKTKKGKISGVVTRQGEGFLHAETVKRTTDEAFYGAHARYTTCDLPHPHFYINASKIKALPGKKIFSGPFNLVFADIPTPLGFLFGYFPTPQKHRSTGSSGIIVPTFGEARQQGFYLRQGGYYLALNEYIGISLLGDIYSYGSWAAHVQSNYNKRYAYQGNFSFDFSGTPQYINNEQTTNPIVGPGRFPRQNSKSFFIRWSHNPAARPGGKISASVQAGSSFYNRQNYSTPSNNLSATFNSSVQYQYANPNSPVTFTASMLHNQNIITKSQNLTLPEATLSVNRQYPFRLFNQDATGGNFLQDISVAYNLTASNQLSNIIRGGTLPGVNLIGGEQRDTAISINGNTIPTILRNAQFGARHSFPIAMNSIRILKHFNLSPNLYYNATTYLRELKYTYVESAKAVRVDTLNKLSLASEYGAGASLSTRIYGMASIKGKRLEAIRHQIQPSLSYNYTPNLTTRYGQNVQLSDLVNSTTGMIPYQYLSRYNGFLNAPSGSGLQSALYFSVQNNVEAKIKAKSDTADTFEKVNIIDNFSFTGGYNFAADSFKVQPLNAQFRTVLFKRLNVFTSANLDPFQVNAAGRRIDRLLINQSSFRFARLTNANLNLDIDLNPDVVKSKREAPRTNRPSLETDVALQDQYIDFKIPWTFRINYTASYFAQANGTAQTTQSLGFDGSLNLTDKWKVTYNSGYDFLNKALTYTSVNIHRDLHCWEMSIGWIPFGVYQSYSVNINARSAILRDLKLSRNRSWYNR